MGVQKTPAFPFYGKDAYDDETFARLSFGAQGLWQFLAWWQWSEGSVPAHLDDILNRVPRAKVRETRALWKHVEPLFPVCHDNPSRRANATVEHHRSRICGLSERRRKGAEITNQKRWGGSLSDSLSDTDSESLRAATANAIGSLSQSTKSSEGVQGEGERPMSETLAAAARLVPLLGASALRDKPPDGIVHAWVRDRGYDEALIRETLTDCEDQYRGKGWRYFEQILATRHADPSQRPSRRTSRKNGNGSAPVDSAPIAVTLRARQEQLAQEQPDVSTIEMLQQFVSAESWEHPSIPADAIPRYVAYIRSELHGDLTQAPTLRHFAEVSPK